jgi:negative regulator of flagellin synthesis FlgM
MKIGNIESKVPLAPLAGDRKTGATAGQPGVAPSGSDSSKVDLSPAASALAAVDPDGTFDAAKVQRIAAAIRDGTYRIDAEAIADKLIANAQELLGRKPG